MQIVAVRTASRAIVFPLLVGLLFLSAAAQQPEPPKIISPHARMLAARSVYVEHTGSRLPNDVIGDAFQGWGRYTVVYDPAKADIIVSINAPVSDSGVSVGDGRPGPGSGTSSRALSSSNVTQIRLLILDAHDRVILWSGVEQPKSSMKERQREDNIVDASLRLFRRFRNVVEPEPAP
jgi:hypothetical protein